MPFALRLAAREARSSLGRLGVYMTSIALGVAALVAINGFRGAVLDAIHGDAQEILGADLRLTGSEALPDTLLANLRPFAVPGGIARVVSTGSMVLAPRSGATRLLQVQAVEGPYPLFGAVRTAPEGLWPVDAREGAVLDSAALAALDVRPGDSIAIGEASFEVLGAVSSLPGDVNFRSAIAPRVYIPLARLDETGILGFGSFSRHAVYVRVRGPAALDAFLARHRDAVRQAAIDIDTAEEQADRLTEAISWLGSFLGLVGLMALLLGGVGVASAVNVFAREKLPSIAVLRCIGASQNSLLLAYVAQAAALGLAGSAIGAALGVALQALLPKVLADMLPVEVQFRFDPGAVAVGLGMGLAVSVLFALIPLLGVRNVAPLQALRRDYDPGPRRFDGWRFLAVAVLAATVVGISIAQAPEPRIGIGFALGIAGAAALLWLAARILVFATHRLLPGRAAYVLRQGIANLFRPRNQTVSVVLALGFGVFLVATLQIVRDNLLSRMTFREEGQPNLFLFDIQPDQLAGVDSIVRAAGATLRQVTPMVPARIASINARPLAELLTDSGPDAGEAWALRREYRHTYRDSLAAGEELVAGRWFDGARAPGEPARISLDIDVAGDLGVGIDDRIVWDVQGVPVESRVASFRTIDWARFQPNFFVVFEPGVLETAPHMVIAMSRVDEPGLRSGLQRDLVRRFPNVSVMDLAVVQQAFDRVAGRVSLAVRLLAGLAVIGGIVVLVGALSTSRYQRLRETALLRTLGARRDQIRAIAFVEYAALGSLAAFTGIGLSAVAGWLLVDRLFDLPFRLPAGELAILWAAVAVLSVVIGGLNARGVTRRSPLETLREAAD